MSTIRRAAIALLGAASVALTPAVAAAQRHCSPSRVPAELPGVDAVVDSTAIAELIAGSGAQGVLRFSIVADVGEAPRAFAIAGGAASAATEWLTPRIEAALRPSPKAATAWGMRLRAVAGSPTELALERSEYCRPQRIPGGAPRTTIRVVVEPGSPRPPRQGPIPIVHVSAEGDLRHVTFLRSSNHELESELRRVMMANRFHPARIDGVPVASTDTLGRP